MLQPYTVLTQQKLCKQPTGNPERRDVSVERYRCSEAPARAWRWDQSQVQRAICSADAAGSLLSKANTPFLVLCDTARTMGEVGDGGEEGFLSPRCPQEPLKPRHKLVATSPHKGALGGLTFIFGLFCLLSLRVFSFPGVLSGLRHFASVGVQHCCHAVPWPGNLHSQLCCFWDGCPTLPYLKVALTRHFTPGNIARVVPCLLDRSLSV